MDRDRRTETLLPLRPAAFPIRLSLAEGERHGYGIIPDARERGEAAPDIGTLYRALARMLDQDLITRRLRQKPLFFAAVLATLTVGLGTFAVGYTAVDKILLEPLPYRDPAGPKSLGPRSAPEYSRRPTLYAGRGPTFEIRRSGPGRRVL